MTAADGHPLTFTISLPVTVRQLRQDDLRKLEWYGQFIQYRYLFLRSYQEQQRGQRLLLVADSAGFPIGRLFIQFNSRNQRVADGQTRAYLYSFQVMEIFRGQGIGTALLQTAESIALKKNYKTLTIAVAKDNKGAQRLYQRHGYTIMGEDAGKWSYRDHRGRVINVTEPSWLLEKRLTIE